MKTFLSIFLMATVLSASQSYAFECNECHSKNPKMQKMHKALGYKDCFSCHGPAAVKSLDERKKQRESDAVCSKCHKK